MHKIACYFSFLAALAAASPALAQSTTTPSDQAVKVFPPENISECNNNTALTWNGTGNVRCDTVIKSLPKLGTPVYWKSIYYRNDWSTFNTTMTDAIVAWYQNSLREGIPQQTVESWITDRKASCLTKNGVLPEQSFPSGLANFLADYCGRIMCAYQTNGAMVVQIQTQDYCNEITPWYDKLDCNHGHFAILWSCFTTQ